MQSDRRLERIQAFTLIELLIVIAIIGLLMAILFPALSAARENGREARCRSELRSMTAGSLTYANSNGDYLCSGSFDPDVANGRDGPVDGIGWVADLLNASIANPGEQLCPSNPARFNQKLAFYPQVQQSEFVRRGYNTNFGQAWYMARTEWNPASGNNNLKRVASTFGALNLSSIKNVQADRVPLLGDGRTDRDESVLNGRCIKTMTDGPLGGPYGIQSYADFGPAHGRGGWIGGDKDHNRIRASIAFADGHVGFFQDHDRDGEFGINRATRPATQKDLRGEVFDGVLSIGRRSEDAFTLK